MYIYAHVYVRCPQKSEEERHQIPRDCTDGCELPRGGREPKNPGPPEEQPVFLTTEPSLQPASFTFFHPSEDRATPMIGKRPTTEPPALSTSSRPLTEVPSNLVDGYG